MTTPSLSLPDTITLSEKIKHAARARWTEQRLLNEDTGEVMEIQYDLTLDLKNSKETLVFRYGVLEGDEARCWYVQRLHDNGDDKSWEDRHQRNEEWLSTPDMIAKLLWDIMTVHGDDAAKRGWSDIQSAQEIEKRAKEALRRKDQASKILTTPGYANKLAEAGQAQHHNPRPGRSSQPGGWTEVK